jgi:hypothetical protein
MAKPHTLELEAGDVLYVECGDVEVCLRMAAHDENLDVLEIRRESESLTIQTVGGPDEHVEIRPV